MTDADTEQDLKTLKENAPEVVAMLDQTQQKNTKPDDKYTLDHTIVVYLIGPQNNFLTYLGSNLDEGSMTDIILDEVSADIKKNQLRLK